VGAGTSPSPSHAGGPLELRRVQALPVPWAGGPLWLKLDSAGGHEALDLRLYSAAYALVWQGSFRDAQAPGWGQLRLDLPALPAGLYYLRAVAERDGAHSPPQVCRLLVLGRP
jgi:hypothetical protein